MNDYLKLVVVAIWISVIGHAGCDRTSTVQPPKYNSEYKGPVFELRFSTPSNPRLEPEMFNEHLTASDHLAIIDTVSQGETFHESMPIRVAITKKVNGNHVIFATGIGRLKTSKQENTLEYRIETKTPRRPGAYLVEVQARGNNVALGRITVKKRVRQD